MKLVVISPEVTRSDEVPIVAELFAGGLERYHLRKPRASAAEVAAFVTALPPQWRERLVLHQHHELVAKYRLAGRHWRDEPGAPAQPTRVAGQTSGFTSRACHDLATLRAALGAFDAVFYGPVFESVSKPGYGPAEAQPREAVAALLATRTESERRTEVLALGGVTLATAPRARALGFDGIAVLGAVWQDADPVAAFQALAAWCRRTPAVHAGAAATVEARR